MPQSQRPDIASSMKRNTTSAATDDYVLGVATSPAPVQQPMPIEPSRRGRRERTSHATFNLPTRIHERLRIAANAMKISQGEIVADAVEKELNRLIESDSRVRAYVELEEQGRDF